MIAAATLETWTVRPLWAGRTQGRVRSQGERRTSRMDGSEAARLNGLVVAVGRAQDRAAFQALFDHFAPREKGYLMRLGAGNAVAADLAQEAMLTLWRKAALFDPSKASASTWIFTIARNLRIDAIRKERRPELDPIVLVFL